MADCRPAGSTTVIVGAGGGVLASTRQFFDQAIVLSHAIAGTIDHRGSKLCNPPLRVEPIRALGAIVSACVIAEKIRDGSPIGTIYDDRQTQRGRESSECFNSTSQEASARWSSFCAFSPSSDLSR